MPVRDIERPDVVVEARSKPLSKILRSSGCVSTLCAPAQPPTPNQSETSA